MGKLPSFRSKIGQLTRALQKGNSMNFQRYMGKLFFRKRLLKRGNSWKNVEWEEAESERGNADG